ncbi:hypothetical protein FH972_001082 [Carpinus fangiana]|uniref:Uncharacterized protein n=1 Tax=Carpinus fangiana TaxID=176857 RepID=A0A5N6QD09_9ROSI|nr:hypothetical protein FH972_001082 [Carpinus fangiana]
MARLVPSIFFVQLIFLLLCMEAQAGRQGPTPDDEGEETFFFFLSLIYTKKAIMPSRRQSCIYA